MNNNKKRKWTFSSLDFGGWALVLKCTCALELVVAGRFWQVPVTPHSIFIDPQTLSRGGDCDWMDPQICRKLRVNCENYGKKKRGKGRKLRF